MKKLIAFYHFLGSIQLAILLIAMTAAFVAAGTFLEAHSESHLFSASFTYHHPVFLALIWGFFLNILISALRRWPYQTKHIPFLTTHLGLLMLLGGVIIKSYYGTQGSMSIIEGGSSNRIFLPNTYAIHLEKKDSAAAGKKVQMDFLLDQAVEQKLKFDDVEIRLADFAPHSTERMQTWVKDQQAVILGQRPIPIAKFQSPKVPVADIKARFHHEKATPWNLIALSTDQISEASKQVYLQGLDVQISNSSTGEIIAKIPLTKALEHPVHGAEFSLEWNFSDLNELKTPTLSVDIDNEKMIIALAGTDSLFNRNVSSPYRGKLPLTIDLSREPTLLLIHDDQENDHLFFFNPYGEIQSASFKNDHLQSLIVYDEGFGGYTVQMPFPFDDLPSSRHDKEQAELLQLAAQLRISLQQDPDLSPPLKLFKNSVEVSNGPDFAKAILLFLQAWENSSQLLIRSHIPDQLHPIIQHIDWNKLPQQEQYVCGWLCLLLDEMEQEMQQGKNFLQVLDEKGWPLGQQFTALDANDTDKMITLFAQQLFAAREELPRPETMPGMFSAKALSAYLRAFGITLNNIRQTTDPEKTLRIYHAAHLYTNRVRKILAPLQEQPVNALAQLIDSMREESYLLNEIKKAYLAFQKQSGQTNIQPITSRQELSQALVHYAPLEDKFLSANEIETLSASLNAKDVILETPLTLKQEKILPLQKWEDNRPLITLEIKQGQKKEYLTLTYDKYGTGLAWPILEGRYILRYQPLFVEIPYKVRLHDARQINYPGTQQPYSYESDIIVTRMKDQSKVEKTISMNNVHETSDGYRFYLASLSPPQEEAAQRVQIVVNHDPAKYFLTYPGALIMSLGIVLLFWMRPYKAGDRR